MAIFHLSVKVIGRGSGRSAVAAAAYRAAERLHDERLDRAHDFTNKSGVVHSEVLLPEDAPEQFSDRTTLWNAVEAAEVRKDAQLAREVEFALPRELSREQGIALAREFADTEFVERGMIADLNVHWDVGGDGEPKPHAHIMLTMREVGPDGFGAKVREWNSAALVEQWRERWAEHVNARLAELDIDARIDHRSHEERGIALEPQDKTGPAASRIGGQGLEAERIEEHREIARRNGERILANPALALDAITHGQATFTRRDLAAFVHRHSDGKDQFDRVLGAVRSAPDLVALGTDGRGHERFTSRAMIETEARLQRAGDRLASNERHRVDEKRRDAALARAAERGLMLSGEQRAAFEHVTDGKGLGVVVGYAGTGKSAMLGVAREAWESAGYTVRGAALSGIAAENLEAGSGMAARTLASLEHQWAQGRELLTARDVLVIDEAGMIGTRQMERAMAAAEKAGAKVVLVGDPQQLQAIEAGAAFRAIHERHGGVEISEVRRQHEAWQQDATRHLATGRTAQAIDAYGKHDMVHAGATRGDARGELIERWDRARQAGPHETRIILTHTNDKVRVLNEAARERLRASGGLGEDVPFTVERGERLFAPGDRIMFLRNERSFGVKNGTLGTVEAVTRARMAVRTDDGRRVAFDITDYAHLDHGYAATIHKAQGVTVDCAHVLATPGMDSHAAYVALSRHRESVDLHYGRDDFADRGKLARVLSRERAKDMASDYAEPNPAQAFAERRGIIWRERISELVRTVPQKVRGIFDGFRPKASALEPVPGTVSGHQPLPARGRSLEAAVVRYATALEDIARIHALGADTLPHQRDALAGARDALDAIRPHAAADLDSALRHEPGLLREAAQGRGAAAIRAAQLEAELRADPALRANRFVASWRQLRQVSEGLERDGDMAGARRAAGQMAGMAKALERDPQMESLLRVRRHELGIGKEAGSSVARDLADSVGMGRRRDLGMSL